MRWFDRIFSFESPLWMFPNILERLRGTPARAEELTLGLSDDILTVRQNNTWSILENVGHLWDLEKLWYGRVIDFENQATVLRPADLDNTETLEANHNITSLDELLRKFRSERLMLVERLENADIGFRAATSLHPRLEQPMRVIDLAFFVAEHDDHHLARIAEIIRSGE